MSDWEPDPEWTKHVQEVLIPMIDSSGATISLVPRGETDIKFAVELGLSIMLDKPLVLMVAPGTTIPKHLRRVADEVIVGELQHPKTQARLTAALRRLGLEVP